MALCIFVFFSEVVQIFFGCGETLVLCFIDIFVTCKARCKLQLFYSEGRLVILQDVEIK